MKYIFILLLLLAPQFSGASVMSDEKSKCMSKESTVQAFSGWKKDFHRFLADYESLDQNIRFTALRGGLRKMVKLTTDLASDTGVGAPTALISDGQRLLNDLESGNLTPKSAIYVMKSGLINFEDSMNDMVYRAQIKFPVCDLVPSANSANDSYSGVGTIGVR